MNKRFKTVAIAAISSIALAGSIVFAQTTTPNQSNTQGTRTERRAGGKHRGHGFGGMRGGFFGQLNLTEDQKTKIQQIHQSFAERNKPLHEQLRAKRQELRQASEGGTFNEALATQKLTEMASLEAKLMGERFRLHQETLSVLTPEQKAQLEQSKAQFKNRRGERRQRDMEQ
jgi:Spy/CpxP family protein refolding chaperone